MAAVVAVNDGMVGHQPGTPTLQLLLRFLPFTRVRAQQPAQQGGQHTTRQRLLEELHKNPLWRFTSHVDATGHLRSVVRRSLPHEVHNALIDYVRLAAEADQQQRPAPRQQYRRAAPASALEVAAELHALYLAATAATQQPQQRSCGSTDGSSEALSDAEVLQLFKAYVGLEDQAGASSTHAGTHHQHRHHKQGSWDSNAAAVLYAFVQLADAAQQQQQQHSAAGQLTRPCPAAGAITDKQAGSSTGAINSGSQGSIGSRKDSDLHILLKLAQLSHA